MADIDSIKRHLEQLKAIKSREGVHWSDLDDAALWHLAQHNTPTRVAGMKLRRSEQAIYARAQHLGISLHPTNQSPYNRSHL